MSKICVITGAFHPATLESQSSAQQLAAVLDEEMALRQKVATHYNDLFTSLRGVDGDATIHAPYIEPHNTSAWAQYTIRVQDRDAVQEKLRQAGIPTAAHYPILLNKQPAVASAGAKMPVGDEVAAQVMSLPMSPVLAMADQALIAETLRMHQAA